MNNRANQHGPAGNDQEVKISPKGFFANSAEGDDVYRVTDDVTDGQFETAIDEARDEGNLSRANLVRKVTAKKAAH